MTPEELHASRLVVANLSLAQEVNDKLIQTFESWTQENRLVATVVCAAGISRYLSLSREDFLTLAAAAYDLLRVEPKPKEATHGPS